MNAWAIGASSLLPRSGMAKAEKVAAYRGKRGDVAEKATWL
jgi:DNA uptake protein ComE-like DNA-binding protein